MIEEDLLREMRLNNAILRAGLQDQIEALGRNIKQDSVSVAILEYLAENGRTSSGDLKKAVVAKVGKRADVSNRTISRRFAELERKGLLWQHGQTSNTGYESTGVI